MPTQREKQKYSPPALYTYGSVRNLTGGSGNTAMDADFGRSMFNPMAMMMGRF